MKLMLSAPLPRQVAAGVLLGLAALLGADSAAGQGCAPSRFSFRGIGRDGDLYLSRGSWQAGFAYRYLTSNTLIQGGDEVDAPLPPSVVKSQLLHASLTYAITDRLAATLNVPLSRGSHETNYPDKARHVNQATGFGDISLSASYWLFSTSSSRRGGNVAVGLGMKAPTGRNNAIGTWWDKDGKTSSFPVHQSIQLGDGGWGLIASFRSFLPVASRVFLHAGGMYTLNPRKTTNVTRSPTDSTRWAVPDNWNAGAGVSIAVWPTQGLTASIEGLFIGTPRRDLIGGKDGDGHRLPANAGYLNPAVQLNQGVHLVTFGVPIRVYKDFKPSYLDVAAGKPGGGGLAKYSLLAQYVVRF